MRIVLDTNVLASALHFGGRPRRFLEDVLRGDHALIIGPAILGELEAVLVETCGWTTDRAAGVRAELEAIAELGDQGSQIRDLSPDSQPIAQQ